MNQKIYFKNSKDMKLCGVLSESGKDKNSPIVILCHGLHSNKERKTYVDLEKALNEKNISTFRFDFHGHGESEGDFEKVTITQAKDDILCAIDFIKSKGYTKIGLFGSSFGGGVSIMAAAEIDDLSFLILRASVAHYKERELATRTAEEINEWKEKGYIIHDGKDKPNAKLGYSFFQDLDNHDAYKAAKKIKIPVLWIHGDQDNLCPVEHSMKLAQFITKCELKILEGADHYFSNPVHYEKTIALIMEFIARHPFF